MIILLIAVVSGGGSFVTLAPDFTTFHSVWKERDIHNPVWENPKYSYTIVFKRRLFTLFNTCSALLFLFVLRDKHRCLVSSISILLSLKQGNYMDHIGLCSVGKNFPDVIFSEKLLKVFHVNCAIT